MTLHDSVFVLNGYAGTGKTTVMGALVRTLNFVGIPTVLLASTGRAAKIFANFTGLPAHTIHRKIYRAPVMSADGRFVARVATNPHVNTVFIVDEASMIGDGADGSGTSFSTYIPASPAASSSLATPPSSRRWGWRFRRQWTPFRSRRWGCT